MIPVEKRLRKVVDALEENASIFDPIVDGLADACQSGGRILLLAEGRLHLLAQYMALEIIGRKHKNGMQLPADAIDASAGDAQAVARRIGPYDAILAVASTCEEPFFAGALEAAKSRGGKIYCICLGRARVEGKVSVAVDVFESRPHHIPGHLAMTLHFIAKRVLGRIGANPLIRPTRLDRGPPRQPSAPSPVASQPAPAKPPQKAEPAPGTGAEEEAETRTWDDVSELVIDLEPDDADLRLIEAHSDAAVESALAELRADAAAAQLPPPPVPTDEHGRVRLIQFRCKDCREPILAEPSEAGGRARCPFCGRRVKVPRSAGRLYHPVAPAMSQGGRSVSLRFGLADCRLAIAAAGGGPTYAGAIEDVSTSGVEALLGPEEAHGLKVGDVVELRVEAPAFLEPLVTTATVERVIPPGGPDGTSTSGRARALLPLHESATKEARAKLARLAEIAQGTTSERDR